MDDVVRIGAFSDRRKYDDADRKGANSVFFLDIYVGHNIKKKKINLPPSVPRHRICGNPEDNNSLASVVYQSGEVLMNDGRRHSGF